MNKPFDLNISVQISQLQRGISKLAFPFQKKTTHNFNIAKLVKVPCHILNEKMKEGLAYENTIMILSAISFKMFSDF